MSRTLSLDQTLTILDGGMGRLLERLGAPFRLPEWSALSLIEAPDYVSRAHRAYVESGADIVTTNSYGLVPHMLGVDRFRREAKNLADRAGRLARAEAEASGRRVLVAGSLPPLFESYRPDRFQPELAPAIIIPLIEGLSPHVDIWLIETQNAVQEARVALDALRDDERPVIVSYTLKDEEGRTGPPELRSGEPVADAVAASIQAGASAIFFNCSQPEVMSEAIRAARQAIGDRPVPVGVYANAFAPEPPSDTPYAGISDIRADLQPANYLKWVNRWIADGASVVGGCCGIGPEHIAEIRNFRNGR